MKLVERATGKIVDVPDTEAHALFMSGKYGVPKGAAMPLKTEMGVVGQVAPGDASLSFERGGTVPTEAEFRQAQAETRYGGPGSALAAGAVGAARGAAGTFGIPTDATALSLASSPGQVAFEGRHEIDPYQGERTISPADALRERLKAYNDLHPVASTVGEIGGMVVGNELGGGLVGAAGKVGRGIAGGVGALAGEGAAIGGVSAANEAALGGADITAAKVLAGVGHGALIGAGLGAAGRIAAEATAGARDRLGRWVGSMRPKDVDALAEKTFGYAPEGIGQRVQQGYAKLASGVAGKDADVISKFTELSPEGAEARRIGVFDAPKIQEETERAVRQHVDDILRSGDIVSAHGKGALKADYVAKAVARGNEGEVRNFAEKQLAKIIEGADAQLTQEMAPNMVKSVESVSKLAYRAQEAVASGNNALAFVELDNLKRGMQRLTSMGYRGLRAVADPVDQINAKRTVTWLDGSAEELRQSLEREDLWGKAAIDQREINAAWSKQIDASKRFHKSLTTEVGRDPANPYLEVRGADPGKVATYVRSLTNPHNDLTHAAVRDYVDSTEKLAGSMRKAYELPADAAAEVHRIEGAAAGFRGTINKAEHSLVLANQYRALLEGSHDSVAGLASSLGFALGGIPGGAIGTAVGAVTNPGRTVAQLAAIERLASKVDSKIADGVRGFLRGERGKLEAPASVHMLAGPGGERATFEAKVREVQRLANNPEEQTSRISSFTSQFDSVAPNVTRALTIATLKITRYLADHAPPGFTPRPEALAWGLNEPALYSDSEMREWSRRAAVANDPTVALHNMKRNMLTPEEADALRVCHFPIYQQVQREIQTQQAQKPHSLGYGQQLQLEVMFAVPLNRTLDRDFMRSVQRTFQTMSPRLPPRPGKDPGNGRSQAAATVSQQLEGGH